MTLIQTLLDHPVVESIGWALIHFVWQGAIIGLVLACVLAAIRRRSSNVKYLTCCCGLLVLAAAPVATSVFLLPHDSGGTVVSAEPDSSGAETGPVVADSTVEPVVPATSDLTQSADAAAKPTPVNPAPTKRPGPTSGTNLPSLSEWLQPHLDWILAGWFAGVVALSVRLLVCWMNVGRLTRRGTGAVSESVSAVFSDLVDRVGVSRPVRLFESSLVQVPTVLGALRPVILLPVTAVSGLSASQLEAILAHELAHVRRHDYLVNLLQTAIETLLFYHPVVWWVSQRIRAERENCCDDVASAVCGDRIEYAEALVRMEEIRGTTPQLAVAATGGSLLQRVRRLVAPGRASGERRRPWWLGGAIPLSLLLLAASCMPFVSEEVTGSNDDDGPDTYVVVWGAVVDRPLADRLAGAGPKLEEQDGAVLRTVDADQVRGMFHEATGSAEVIRLSDRMKWLAPLGIYMPPENLTGTISMIDNVQFRVPDKRGDILFTQILNGQHRVLPEKEAVRLKLRLNHNVQFEAFNTGEDDSRSNVSGKMEIDQSLPDGQAMLVTRELKPALDWSPVLVTVFEPVRVPARLSRQRQIHDLPSWLEGGPEAIRRRAQAADNWTEDVAPQSISADGKWSQLLKSGARVTLVGLSSPKNSPTAWWTPDGEPLVFNYKRSIGLPVQEMFALLHVIHSPEAARDPGPIDLAPLLNPTSQMSSGGVIYLHGSDRAEMPDAADGQLVIVPVDTDGPLQASVGIGTDSADSPLLGVVHKDKPLVLEEGEFEATQVLERRHHRVGTVTDVSMTFPRDATQQVLVTAIGTDGQRVESEYRPRILLPPQSLRSSVFDRFLIPPEKVSHFEVRKAPISWATFTGFSGMPAELQVATVKAEPTATALVGWTIQGKSFDGLTNGAVVGNGRDLHLINQDSEYVRGLFQRLIESGDLDPPGPNVGWMFDWDEFQAVTGTQAYRGPPVNSFPFGYSTGILPAEDRADLQAGMWTLSTNCKAVPEKPGQLQIDATWTVSENNPGPDGKSLWREVFNQPYPRTFEAPPLGRCVVMTGPVAGLSESGRSGAVVFETVSVPKSLIQRVRSRRTDVEQLIKVGPAGILAMLAAGETTELVSETAAPELLPIRGRVVDYNMNPVEGAAVFPLGSSYRRWHALTLSQGKATSRGGAFGSAVEDTRTIRAYTDAEGRFEIKLKNVTDLAVSSTVLDVWEVEAPKPGHSITIQLPRPGRLNVSHSTLREGETSRGIVRGPLRRLPDTPDGDPVFDHRFRCSARRQFEVSSGTPQTIGSLTSGEYWVALERSLKHGDFSTTYGIDRTRLSIKAGKPTDIDFGRAAGVPVDVRVSGLEERGIEFNVVEVQPLKDDGTAVDRWLFSDVGLTTTGQLTTERLLPGRYRIRARGYSARDADKGDRDFHRPDGIGSEIITIPELGESPVVDITLKIWGNEAVAANKEKKTAETEKSESPSPVSVFGRVVDAETGEPITKFITQAGKFDPKKPEDVTWGFSEGSSTAASKGRFSTTVRWQAGWTARILADGYLPQPVITKAPKDGETRIEVELRLKRGRWVRGRVLDHTGKPAKGVAVYALGKRGINLAGGKAVNSFGGNDDSRVRTLTSDDGRFEMTVGEATRLAVSSPNIDAWPGDLPEGMKETVIKLPEPGRVIVDFDIEGAGEKQDIFWQFLGHSMPGFEGITSEQTREVKNGEKLEITSLPPGKYQIGRSRMLRTGQMGMGRFLDRHWFTVKSGETVTINFTRPTGARIKGIVEGLKETTVKTALITVTPIKEPENPDAQFEGWLTLDGQATNEDGEFTTERLPPGEYKLLAEAYLPLTPEQRFRTGIPTPTFTGESTVVVPEDGEAPDVKIELKQQD